MSKLLRLDISEYYISFMLGWINVVDLFMQSFLCNRSQKILCFMDRSYVLLFLSSFVTGMVHLFCLLVCLKFHLLMCLS